MTTASSTAKAHRTRLRTRFRFGSAILATGAVLALGAGLAACENGVALCLDDHKCVVGVKTDDANASKTVKVFGGDNPMSMTVAHITDNSAEVTIGDNKKTVNKDSKTTVGNVRITLSEAEKNNHFAELHVERD